MISLDEKVNKEWDVVFEVNDIKIVVNALNADAFQERTLDFKKGFLGGKGRFVII